MQQLFSHVANLLNQKQFKQAYDELRVLKPKNDQQTVTLYEMRAFCAVNMKLWKEAIQSWLQLLDISNAVNKKTELFWNIALASEQLKDVAMLKKVLLESIKLDESHSNIKTRMKLCELAGKLNEFNIIEQYAPKLLEIKQAKFPALTLLIKAANANFDKVKVLRYLRELLDQVDKLPPQLISFTLHNYFKLNEYNLAEKLIQQVNKKHQSELWFNVLQGILFNYQKDFEKTTSLLIGAKASDLPNWFGENELLYVTLGKAYDKLGEFDKSFNCFELMAESYQKKYLDYKKYDVINSYQSVNLNNLPRDTNYLDYAPAFMLGFPRSGTTLLETILDTHEQIETLSEPNTISAVIEEIKKLVKSEDYPRHLTKLSDEDIESLRGLYFECVEQQLGNKIEEKVFIDKMPLYTVYIPVINLLFPNAKFIINIRHPLDVILSNFQQNFTVNNEMSFLFSIDDCAQRYNQVMTFLEDMEEFYKLDSITIKYEDLLNDINSVTNSLFSYLRVSESADVENFHQHAKQKVINTPSSSEVSQPLYQSSKYKWKNYEKYLTPYKEQLSYFIDKYGYSEK